MKILIQTDLEEKMLSNAMKDKLMNLITDPMVLSKMESLASTKSDSKEPPEWRPGEDGLPLVA